jgi:acetyl esterase/lipase
VALQIAVWIRRIVGVVAATAVIRSLTGVLVALAPVARDLRTPMIFLPIAPRGRWQVAAMRRLDQRVARFPVAAGVITESRKAHVVGRMGVRVVTYARPDRVRSGPALLWVHGGGTVIGRPEQHNALCSRWAEELDLLVVGVDYRLAPEHPFPAPLEDCYTALCWMHEIADELGADRARIAVGGSSAGGLLAASLCQLARDRGGPPICFQLLEYPMLDDRTVLRPPVDRSRSFVWSPAASRFGWTSYLGTSPAELNDRRYSAPGRTPDLAGLPSAWIGVGDIDLLHDEAVAYAARLRSARVPCRLHIERGMYHGADVLRPKAPTSVAFRKRMTDALVRGTGSMPS